MKKNINLRLVGLLLLGMMLASACTQPYSQAPLASPTLLPTGLFVSPFPSGQDPLQIIADLGTQTAMAGTNVANGTPTPSCFSNVWYTVRCIDHGHPGHWCYHDSDYRGAGHRHAGWFIRDSLCNSLCSNRLCRPPRNLYTSNGRVPLLHRASVRCESGRPDLHQ